jgi:hypothetical protein
MLLALAALPQLSRFVMRNRCVSRPLRLTKEGVRASVSAERHSKGWPPMTLALVDQYGCSEEEEDEEEGEGEEGERENS